VQVGFTRSQTWIVCGHTASGSRGPSTFRHDGGSPASTDQTSGLSRDITKLPTMTTATHEPPLVNRVRLFPPAPMLSGATGGILQPTPWQKP
jgi:hypothetical protein